MKQYNSKQMLSKLENLKIQSQSVTPSKLKRWWQKIKCREDEILHIAKQQNPISQMKNDIFVMISLLNDFFSKRYTGVKISSIAMILFTLGYILNPFDLCFDFIYPIGWLDDIYITFRVLKLIQEDFIDYKTWKKLKNYQQDSL